jgi:hypothetical protein
MEVKKIMEVKKSDIDKVVVFIITGGCYPAGSEAKKDQKAEAFRPRNVLSGSKAHKRAYGIHEHGH